MLPSNRSFRPTLLFEDLLELLLPLRSTSIIRVLFLEPQQQHMPNCMKAANKLQPAATHISTNAIFPSVGTTVRMLASISLCTTAHMAVVTAAARNVARPEHRARRAIGIDDRRERGVIMERTDRRPEEMVVAKKAPKEKWDALRIRVRYRSCEDDQVTGNTCQQKLQ